MSEAMRRATAFPALLLLLMAGCLRSSPTEPEPDRVQLGVPFRLATGETAEIEGESVAIRFDAVTADSRCPSDVACAWEGEARAALDFRRVPEPSSRFELSTHQPRQVEHAGYRMTLRRVLPAAPRAGSRIPASDYVVEIQVDR